MTKVEPVSKKKAGLKRKESSDSEEKPTFIEPHRKASKLPPRGSKPPGSAGLVE